MNSTLCASGDMLLPCFITVIVRAQQITERSCLSTEDPQLTACPVVNGTTCMYQIMQISLFFIS